MRKIKYTLFFLIILQVNYAQSQKYPKPVTRILFVFDASNSMNGIWGNNSKFVIARDILCHMVDSLQTVDNVELALRVFGHQSQYPPGDCSDTKLETVFAKKNGQLITQKLFSIYPKGITPIARSLEQATKDFPDCENCRNIIILLTDGIEECNGDPCAISQALQKKGIILKPFIIGIDINHSLKKKFDCVGEFFDASNEKRLKEVLNIIISHVLNSTTLQVNLLDSYGKPTETDVNMTITDNFSGKILYNYIHTINDRGNPDTIYLDPSITYKAEIHTIPHVFIDTIKLIPGKHKIVAADAPQGYLTLILDDNQYGLLNYVVRKAGDMQTLNVQQINTLEKYLTGKYDLEIFTLPRTYIKDVEIKQSYTTSVQIPKPGTVTITTNSPGYGSIYLEKDNQLEWIYNLNPNLTKQNVVLQPGRYKVIFRAKNKKETLSTTDNEFKITSGVSFPLEIN
jgi:Ca-activated chloride channel homolog